MADILIVSLGSTSGLRMADQELCQALRRCGQDAQIASAEPQPQLPTMMLTDLAWARAARTAAVRHLRREPSRALIYSTTTAALLWPSPGAIRFDAPAAANRPGRHGLWQRPLERRRLAAAPLLLPYSDGALRELAGHKLPGASALVLPVAIGASGQPAAERDIAAIAYGANPHKKGLDLVLEAWETARRACEELVVTGIDEQTMRASAIPLPERGVRFTGMLAPAEFRALTRRARVFVCAPRREDYGQTQLEALADGCQLITTAAPGPYAALEIARELDPRLVGDDLAGALRSALDAPQPDYATRAARLLERYSQSAIDTIIAEQLLPRLLRGC